MYSSYRVFPLLMLQAQQLYHIQGLHMPGYSMTAVVLRTVVKEMRNVKLMHKPREENLPQLHDN